MYISIETNDFPGLKNGVYPLGNDTLIEGNYSTGKTSLLNAISYALTGRDINGLLIKNITGNTLVRLTSDNGSTFGKDRNNPALLSGFNGFNKTEAITIPISKVNFNTFRKDILEFIKSQNHYTIESLKRNYPQTSKEKMDSDMTIYKGALSYLSGLPAFYLTMTGSKMKSFTEAIILLNQLLSYSYNSFLSACKDLESFKVFMNKFYTENPFKLVGGYENIDFIANDFFNEVSSSILSRISKHPDYFEILKDSMGMIENMWIRTDISNNTIPPARVYLFVDGKINIDFIYLVFTIDKTFISHYYKNYMARGLRNISSFSSNTILSEFFDAITNSYSVNLYKHFENFVKALQKTSNEIMTAKTNYYVYKNTYSEIINEKLSELNMNFNGSYITTKVFFNNELRDIETLSSYERFLYEVKITTSLMKMMNIPIILIDDFYYDLNEEFAENIVAQCEDLQLVITKRSLDKTLKIST